MLQRQVDTIARLPLEGPKFGRFAQDLGRNGGEDGQRHSLSETLQSNSCFPVVGRIGSDERLTQLPRLPSVG